MKRIERTAEIAAPAGPLFDFVSDPARLPEWQAGIVAARQTTPGPTRIGSVAHVERELMGQRIEVDLVVTAFEPGHRLSLESEASGFHVEATLELKPVDADRTTISFAMTVNTTNMFMAPVEGMVASAADGDIDTSLDRLRALFATS